MKNISFENIKLGDGFWLDRYNLNKNSSIKSVYERFEETGRFDTLRFNYTEGKIKPGVAQDSDVAKWIEAVSYLYASDHDCCAEEIKIIDELVESMEKNQMADGYLNPYFMQLDPENRFVRRPAHELYSAGHLIEAAIAYHKATGKDRFLNVMLRFADCIEKAFITEKTAKFQTPGHEEIELALVKLYDHTGNKKYLDMAMHFIDIRGTTDEPSIDANVVNLKYDQHHMPVREMTEAEGHAVRAAYLYIGMSEAAQRTGDVELQNACDRIFDNITKKRMYITGGIGSSGMGEAFTVTYDLPNLKAYTESCAAIALLLFCLSLQNKRLDARYGAVIERIMYNNLLSSTSADGTAFFYENPLEIHMHSLEKETCMADHKRSKLPIRTRQKIFQTSCCPPNINRIFARIGDVFFSEQNDALVINQYAALTLNNDNISLEQKTVYPLNGKVTIKATNNKYKKVFLRIPEWCDDFEITAPVSYRSENGYIVLDGMTDEFEITVDFKMSAYFVEAHPNVRYDCGRAALCYGPVVYCIERCFNDYELNALTVNSDCEITVVDNGKNKLPDLTLTAGLKKEFDGLYRKKSSDEEQVPLVFKPYYTFANNGECDMMVWVNCR
ncbi:MAG: glycoside hydrolase family 127 protein [Clostridia bacterium]|nr:glycoside hydrolase family 127 protein [Clostridia bacterium]